METKREFDLDDEMALDLIGTGKSPKELARDYGVSVLQMNKKIKGIQDSQGVIVQYRGLQALELTELQSQILDAVTPDKIEGANLRDLMLAYKVLKEKELLLDGKPTEIHGLLGYLIMLEKEETDAKQPMAIMEPSIDAEFTERLDEDEDDDDEPMPRL